MSSPLIYLLLGAADSGRREVLADLVSEGLSPEMHPFVLVAAGESPPPEDVRASLEAVPNLISATWTRREDGAIEVETEMPVGATHVFFVTDGRANPVDQVEAFHAWLPTTGFELARIITVVNCQLAQAHPELLRWYDACVHFSDVVLLNRREGVPNKWVSDFVARFGKQHLPCLIEQVKKGGVENPALVLEPEARRISMLFDDADEWTAQIGDAGDAVVVEDDGEEKSDADDVEDKDLIGEVDPYLERLAGSGRRAKEIPNIAKFLEEKTAGS